MQSVLAPPKRRTTSRSPSRPHPKTDGLDGWEHWSALIINLYLSLQILYSCNSPPRNVGHTYYYRRLPRYLMQRLDVEFRASVVGGIKRCQGIFPTPLTTFYFISLTLISFNNTVQAQRIQSSDAERPQSIVYSGYKRERQRVYQRKERTKG